MVLRRGYGTLNSVVWYFEECCMVLWRVLCGTLKKVMYTLKIVVWYFEEFCVVL